MSTVIDEAVESQRLPSDQECFDFVPPECCLGDKVHFWAKGKVDPKVRPEVGIIVERPTTRKTITVHLLHTGVNKTTVRHVSDPNLVRRPNLREAGAWDFMQSDKELSAWRKGVDEKLAELGLKMEDFSSMPGSVMSKENLKSRKQRLAEIERNSENQNPEE